MSTDSLITQKDTRKKKKTGMSVMDKIRRTSAKFKRQQKQLRKGKRTDPFPEYEYKTIKHKVRVLTDDDSEEVKQTNKEAAFEKVLVLKKGYPNLPTQRGIQIGETMGNGKTFVGSKGRIVTRRKLKKNQKG